MDLLLWILISLLVASNLFLIIAHFVLIKKVTPLSKKEKEFIEFTINMYIKYGEELEITSPEEHDYIVKELDKLKNRYFNV
jgi:histidinol phosphatase-like PHP family hydrolase